jgi:glycolate oxidase
MIDKNTLEVLVSFLGSDGVLTSYEDLTVYAYDASAPAQDVLPEAVVLPKTRQQVSAVIRLANERGIPVIPRGSGTGLAGGSVPVPGSIILVTTRLNRIEEIDVANLTASVEPGVLTGAFAAEVERHGLFYPPDPASMAISTIGGNVAVNSGGLRGLKYGVTRDYVLGLEVVLANGQVLSTGGKCKKDAAGYNLTSLFVGSEGTLGVITHILLRLIPLPEARRTAVCFFDDVQAAAEVVADAIAARIIPVTLELLDGVSIRCVEEHAALGLPTDLGAMLLIEVDGPSQIVDGEIQQVLTICQNHDARQVQTARSAHEAERLRAARRSTLAALARRRPTTILEDVTVPRHMIPKMVARIRQIAERNNVEIAIFGHAGDGNLHPTGMTDARDPDELRRMEAAFREIFETALLLGGTITGEHGIGLKKRDFLPMQAGEAGMATMRAIKNALDPNGILNPGKVFRA